MPAVRGLFCEQNMAHVTRIPQTTLQGILAAECARTFVDTIRVEHSQTDTIRLVNDNQYDLQRADGLYHAFPFEVTPPTQTDEKPPTLKISVDNVDFRLTAEFQKLRGVREKPAITLERVTLEEPDDVLVGPWTFYFTEFQTSDDQTKATISADLIPGALNSAYPAYRFAPSSAGE